MGIRIGGDDDSGPLSAIRKSIEDAASANRNISSGNRINQAADDASGLSIAENLAARIRSFDAAQRNLQAGVSLAQTAEGGLNSIQQGAQRIRELAVRASNGTLSDEDRQAIQAEVTQIRAEIDRTATQTEFNGRQLLTGASGGANAVEITSGIEGETANIDISDTRAIAIGLDTADVTTQGGAQAAIAAADAALAQVSGTRAEVGAQQNALQRISNRISTAAVNEAAAESRIRGADVAAESTRRAAAQIRTQFAIAVQAQQNQNRGSVLRLLEG